MNLRLMRKICCLDKNTLKSVLKEFLKNKGYNDIVVSKKYMYAEGEIPVCLIAHLDTVFKHPPQMNQFYYDPTKQVLWNPGGSGFDDKAGIYAIIQLLEEGYKPHVIFPDLEEKGGLGATSLVEDHPTCPFKNCKYLIELDRANRDDMVFYDCDNKEFTDYIGSFGFKEENGLFSDISILGPEWGAAAVNLSVGYQAQHTTAEHLHCSWCDETIERVKQILDDAENAKCFEYIPFVINYTEFNCFICRKKVGKTGYLVNDHFDFVYPICKQCKDDYFQDTSVNIVSLLDI